MSSGNITDALNEGKSQVEFDEVDLKDVHNPTQFVFDDGKIVANNRAYRRKKQKGTEDKVARKKGYIPYLDKIRHVRKRNGKTKVKYIDARNR